jgi:hypothetical protein
MYFMPFHVVVHIKMCLFENKTSENIRKTGAHMDIEKGNNAERGESVTGTRKTVKYLRLQASPRSLLLVGPFKA